MSKEIAVCPKDRTHKTFITSAYVSEMWIVDCDGNFCEVAKSQDTQVLHYPDPDNTWECATCGAEAEREWQHANKAEERKK